jgi:uncharacterized repeat protein (TIGR03803 family)
MKIHIQNRFLLPMLIAGLGLIPTGRATAQTFRNLYNFSVDFEFFNGNVSNSDGYGPSGSLILSGNTLYGTASQGGSWGSGTVFAVTTDGSDFTNLHSFTATSGSYPNYTNSDGNNPSAGLLLAGSTLYGTASSGGTNGNGAVFAINTDGTSFTNLHGFSAEATNSLGRHTNSDGYNPVANLILSGNTLYGTASEGGTNGCGTVFAVNTNGTGFTNLHSFTATTGSLSTNSDGATPVAGLILSDNTLYGTAGSGGTNGNGTVFAINTNGTGFTVLHSLANSDGANPAASLILSGNTLYGTTSGTVFKLNTNGSSFTVLVTFPGGVAYDSNNGTETNSVGYRPSGSLILSGNTLYGTTQYGAIFGSGTVFSISLSPQLIIMRSGTNVIVTWPASFTGFTLEFATNLVPPTVWQTNSTASVVISGQNVVTNPISSTQQFYRLAQ